MDRIYTGFERLDKHLKIHRGELVVIGARPAIGKTCFLCSMIEKSIDKQKIMFFSMQTNKHKAVERLQLMGINKRLLIKQVVDLYDIFLKVIAINKENQTDAVFIDNFSDLQAISGISTEKLIVLLKSLAKQLNFAVIISDGLEWIDERRPNHRDLKHKELIKYADKIIIINRPDRTATEKEFEDGLVEKNVAEIITFKNKEEYYSPFIELKFDNINFTFNEIPETP